MPRSASGRPSAICRPGAVIFTPQVSGARIPRGARTAGAGPLVPEQSYVACDGRTAVNTGPWVATAASRRLFHQQSAAEKRRWLGSTMPASAQVARPNPAGGRGTAKGRGKPTRPRCVDDPSKRPAGPRDYALAAQGRLAGLDGSRPKGARQFRPSWGTAPLRAGVTTRQTRVDRMI